MSRVVGKQADPAKSKTPATTASVEPSVEEPPSPSPVPEDVPPVAPASAGAEGSAKPQPDEKVTCFRCSCCVPRKDAVTRGDGRRYACRPCHATATMLSRHGITIDAELDSQDSKDFFERAKAERGEGKGSLQYSQLRALVKQSISRRFLREYMESEEGTFKPLSMWRKDGLTEQELATLEKEAPCRTHPVLNTKTYCLVLDKQTSSKSWQQAEAKVLSLESNMKKRKQKALPAPAGKKAVKQEPEQSETAAVEEPALADLESEEELLLPPPKDEDKEARKARKAAERAARKAAAKLFQSQVGAAAKLQPKITPTREKLEKIWQKVRAGAGGLIAVPSATQEEVKETLEKFQTVEKDVQTILQLRAKGKIPEDTEYSFAGEKELALFLKCANSLTKTLHGCFKAVQ